MIDAAKILLEHGGIFPYLNLISMLAAITIIVERLIALFRYDISGDQFMAGLVKMIREGKIDLARKACQAVPASVLARVMKAGLDSSNRGEAEISAAMEETMMEVTPLVGKRIPALFPLANVATLIGLIGTISGLIKCFRALGSASPETKATVLSTGISEAMYNTAFGLMIAVSCIVMQLYLATKAKGMIEELEYNAVKLENLLGRRIAGDIEPEKVG